MNQSQITPAIISQTSNLLLLISQNTEKFQRLIGFALNSLQIAERKKSFGRTDLFQNIDNLELNEIIDSFKKLGFLTSSFSLSDIKPGEGIFKLFEELLLLESYHQNPEEPHDTSFSGEGEDIELYNSAFFDDSESLHTKISSIILRYNDLTGKSNTQILNIRERFQHELSEAFFAEADSYIDTFCNQQLFSLLDEEEVSSYDLESLNNFLKLLGQEEILSESEYIQVKESLPKKYALYTLSERLFVNGFFTDNTEIEDKITKYYEGIGYIDGISRLQELRESSETFHNMLYHIVEIIKNQSWDQEDNNINIFMSEARALRILSEDEYHGFLELYDDAPELILNEILLKVLFTTDVKDDENMLSILGHHLAGYYERENPQIHKRIIEYLEHYGI